MHEAAISNALRNIKIEALEMNDAMANAAYNSGPSKAHRAVRERRLQASEFEWHPTREKFSERLYSVCNWFCCFGLALGRGIRQIPGAFVKSYFAVRALPVWRQINVFFLMPLVFYSLTFHTVDWWFKEPPEDLFTSAQASETIQSNTYRKADKDGFFLEDCY